MSGHSKWSTIKRSKDAADQKRGAIFSKLAKAITLASREGGGDQIVNFKLRLAVTKAKQANMPKDNIKRAIESGSRKAGETDYKEDIYEAYGPGGSALIIETLTNNANRTISEIKFILTKLNGKLAEKNSALRLFEKVGIVTITYDMIQKKDKDRVELLLIELGAKNIEEDDENLVAFFPAEQLNKVTNELEKQNIPALAKTITRPLIALTLTEKEGDSLKKLTTALEEISDIKTVLTNVKNF